MERKGMVDQDTRMLKFIKYRQGIKKGLLLHTKCNFVQIICFERFHTS